MVFCVKSAADSKADWNKISALSVGRYFWHYFFIEMEMDIKYGLWLLQNIYTEAEYRQAGAEYTKRIPEGSYCKGSLYRNEVSGEKGI